MFEIYGAPNCSYCDRAKWLVEHYGAEYTYTDVSRDPETQQAFFTKFKNVKTVPQIIFDGKDRGYPVHIGGYDDLVKWFDDYEKAKVKIKIEQGLDIGHRT